MNSTVKTAFLVCIGLALLVGLFAFAADDTYRLANAGLVLIIAAVIYFFLGLILVIPKQARKVGQALLLCSVIILVIGFSICSAAPFNFH